jgi:hypothetical protein
MDRRAVGEAARGAAERLRIEPRRFGRNCLPKKAFPGYPSVKRRRIAGHLPVTMMRDETLCPCGEC